MAINYQLSTINPSVKHCLELRRVRVTGDLHEKYFRGFQGRVLEPVDVLRKAPLRSGVEGQREGRAGCPGPGGPERTHFGESQWESAIREYNFEVLSDQRSESIGGDSGQIEHGYQAGKSNQRPRHGEGLLRLTAWNERGTR